MDIEAEKQQLLELIKSINNPTLISDIKKLISKRESKDFWNELSQAQQDEIDKADREVKDGLVSDYDSFIAAHRG